MWSRNSNCADRAPLVWHRAGFFIAMIFMSCVNGNVFAQDKNALPPAPATDPATTTPPKAEPYDESQAANDEKAARKMVEDIRSLVLPQQKETAEELIKKYPNTKVAKLAEQLIEEYRMYDALMEARRAEVAAQTEQVRNFWKTVYPGNLNLELTPTRISNLTDEPVLYQIRGPETAWSGPHNLRIGESHVLNYPALFRRLTREGTVEYSLNVGRHYVFRRTAPDRLPELFTARDQ